MSDALRIVALQSAALFLLVWLIFRIVSGLPAAAKAWIWRVAFLKPLVGLAPFAVVSLHVLAAPKAIAPMDVPPSLGLPPVVKELAATPTATSVDPVLLLWIAGALGVAGYGLWGWFRALRFVRHADPPSDPEARRMLDELTARAGLRRSVRLLMSPAIDGPMLVGGMRPAILLPASATDPDRSGDVRLMLAHEIAHLARRDLFWFGVTGVVQALFFFNPFVWLAARRSRLDHESATDRYACELADVSTQTYGEMLLRVTVVARTSPLVLGILPMAESYRSIHQRLEAMTHFNLKPSRLRTATVAALALIAVASLPLYQLASASPQQGASRPGASLPGTLLYSVSKNAKNPFKYSVYQVGEDLWIQIEKDGKLRRYLWETDKEPTNWMKGTPDALNYEYSKSDVRTALRDVFRFAKHSYTIAPDVQGTITMYGRNIGFETALNTMLKQVGATFHVENGVYMIVNGG